MPTPRIPCQCGRLMTQGYLSCQTCFLTKRRSLTDLRERLWANVTRGEGDGCWLWTASTNNHGYGTMSFRCKSHYVHRLSWMLHHDGRLPPKGLNVLHRCDNPPCVNPDHLFLGTHKDNMRDCIEKGRFVCAKPQRGSAAKVSKLTESQVGEIRQRYSAGRVTSRNLGREYGVDKTTILHIVHRRSWAHVP